MNFEITVVTDCSAVSILYGDDNWKVAGSTVSGFYRPV
jgi:hypothetical protein